MSTTYETTYKDKDHFSFGKNWQSFLKTLDKNKIKEAKASLVAFLGGEDKINGKTFVDIGCGSGLFSLAAYELGAERVVSVDVDVFSLACTKFLREKKGNPKNWELQQGSALDVDFMKSLGQFDIVYSWGVLHHTGDMYKAFDNTIPLLGGKSSFYLAIYNRNTSQLKEGTSQFWLKVKRIYNNSGILVKNLIAGLYMSYFVVGLMVLFINPIKYIRSYKSNRGMNWYHDIIDWLGGYPYECAGPDEIINYFGVRNISCKKLVYHDGIGCSEFLLTKNG